MPGISAKSQDMVPPFGCGWLWWFQATDPASDPANMVGPGKLWIESDDDLAPTVIVGIHTWKPDDTGWLDWPLGVLSSGGDADTLDGMDSTDFATPASVAAAVAAAVAGLSWKQAVRVATTGNGTLATAFENGDTVDGVTLATGNRILLKNQSAGAENGIYTVNASGAPTRATDADSGAELVNASVYVSEGTANADTQWTCTTNAPITLGSTALVFSQLTTGGAITSVFGRTGIVVAAAGDYAIADITGLATALSDIRAGTAVYQMLEYAISDEITDLTTGTAKLTVRMPFAMTLTGVRSSLSTVSSSGLVTVDINEAGSTILSTNLSIDASEKTSVTAATPAVISDVNLADDAEITFDIDAAGTGARGLKVKLIGTKV